MGSPARQIVEPELLRQLLSYDPETGKLFWLPRAAELLAPGRNGSDVEARRWNTNHAGREALTHTHASGYRVGALFGRHLAAHRAAWTIQTGNWPSGEIDHIDGVRDNNRFVNLRDVTPAENTRNACRRRDNKSGHTGVYWRTGLGVWGASIRRDKKLTHLGFFDKLEDAVAARARAQADAGFHQNHGRPA